VSIDQTDQCVSGDLSGHPGPGRGLQDRLALGGWRLALEQRPSIAGIIDLIALATRQPPNMAGDSWRPKTATTPG
jgi:hypothetical protein